MVKVFVQHLSSQSAQTKTQRVAFASFHMIINMKLFGFLLAAVTVTGTQSYSTSPTSRRDLLRRVAAASSAAILLGDAQAASAADQDPLVPVYFGAGCFWHLQHEFIQGERDILGRDNHQLTAAAGYAGGTATDKEGRVCYHNAQRIADYGRLGHGEVVGMKIPESKIGDFAELYFTLFNPKTKDRVDYMDKGGEYRSLLGLPGGTSHSKYSAIQSAADAAGYKLVPGKGNDPDTLGTQSIFVYDSSKYPFYQAEVYHQYHNDFLTPAYGKAYNALADLALEEGRIKGTGCPDRV